MSLTWNTTTGTVNTEVTGTFTFKDNNVRAMYVDWDDGESNKKTEANYQWFTSTENITGTTLTHTYNATGTFYPVIQTVNSNGFVSRYYSANSSEADLVPFSQDTNIASLPMVDSAVTGVTRVNNTDVKAGIDNSVFEDGGPGKLYISIMPTLTDTELAYFSPIEVDITCVLALPIIDGTGSMTTTSWSAPSGGEEHVVQTLSCVLSGTGLTGNTGLKDVLKSGSATNGALISGASVARVLEVIYKNPKYMGASGKTSFTENAALNKLKIGLFTASSKYGNGNITGRGLPVCYVTAGDPIKRANDADRLITADFSQSRPAASNASISSYFYDTGKMWFSPVNGWATSGASSTLSAGVTAAVTEIPVTDATNFPASGMASIAAEASNSGEMIYYDGVSSTALLNVTRGFINASGTHNSGAVIKSGGYTFHGTDTHIHNYWQFTYPETITSTKSLAYTYMLNPYGLSLDDDYNPWFYTSAAWSSNDATTYVQDQFPLDDFGRFMDQYYLVRSQGKAGANSYKNPLHMPNVFRITPVRSWNKVPGSTSNASASDARGNPTKILDDGATNADSNSKDYTNQNLQNSKTGQISLSGTNDHTWRDMDNNDRTTPLQEYLIVLLDSKTDKLFFNMSNYAPYLQSSISTAPPWGIDSVSLLKVENSGNRLMNAYWEPVEFTDGTASSKEYRDTTNDKYSEVSCSLSKSGIISYDMIDNWNSVTLEDLAGGKIGLVTSSNDYDFGIMSGSVSGSVQTGTEFGDYFVITGTSSGDISSKFKTYTTALDAADIGSFKYIAQITSPAGYDKNAFWLTKDGDDGWDGDDTVYFHIGDSSASLRDSCESLSGDIEFVVRRINMYNVFTGFSKVYLPSGGTAHKLLGVDSEYPSDGFPNQYTLYPDDSRGDRIGESIEASWRNQQKYAVKIGLSGTMDLGSDGIHPELWNIFDANQSSSAVVRVIDDSAYNLNSLAITSSINVGRAGTYYKAVTHKGKVVITKTGVQLQEVGFTSVALGDESVATSQAFDNQGPSTLYGHLHTLRKIQAQDCRVYWDEPQKDGTFLRLFGVVQNINETAGVGGPRRIVNYTFTLGVDGIALLDTSGKLMTDIFPLGGIADEQTYT